MAKAFASVTRVQINEGVPYLIYEVCVTGADVIPFGADYRLDDTLSMQENETALKNKVVDLAIGYGAKLSTGDVILSGAWIVKDDASYIDKSKGITSDRSAVVKEDVKVAEAEPLPITPLMAAAEPKSMWQRVKDWFA